MKTFALCALIAIGLGGLGGHAYAEDAYAEDEEAPAFQRGFKDGKFVDDYFGIVYEVPGLEEGFVPGSGGQQALWSGKAEGGATVELICAESGEDRAAADWLARIKKVWAGDDKERKEMKEGTEPRPWVSFVQESLAGFQRHHGYAFYTRDHQVFIVHARVGEKSDTSDDVIQKLLAGLTVEPEKPNCFFLAHLHTSRNSADPREPMSVLTAATGTRSAPGYMTEGTPFYAPELALKALLFVQENMKLEERPVDEQWQFHSMVGLMQLTSGRREDSIPTWKKCIELAPQTSEPASLGMNAHYNLACAYSLLERLDEAFAALEKAFETGSADDVAGLKEHSKADGDLENVRADERWQALVGE